MSSRLFVSYVARPLQCLPSDPVIMEVAHILIQRLLEQFHSADIQHIGSTAVLGLPGKNSINILIAVPFAEYGHVLKTLESLGAQRDPMHYQEVGEDGQITSPDSHAKRPLRVGQFEEGGMSHAIHLHIVEKDSQDHYNPLLLRDMLRKNSQLVQEYAQYKRVLIEQGADFQRYGNAKQQFIRKLLAQASHI